VITGAVRTHFIDNLPTTQLAQGSLYSPAKDEIEAVMNTKAVRKNFVDVRGYAEQVVDNVLRTTPKKRQWAGGVATLIWIASTFLWATAWVCFNLTLIRVAKLGTGPFPGGSMGIKRIEEEAYDGVM
jgi:1-acylglycerone phosphate reductase